MSGVAIMRTLLAQHAPLTALVQPVNIIAGTIALGTLKSAISVRSVGSTEFWTTANNLTVKMVRERVQVTAYSNGDFPLLERILKAASLGRGVYTGVVGSYSVRSILKENVGPYFGPGDNDKIHEQSRDFMVTFMEAN